MIKKVSLELSKNKIYHKKEGKHIFTRRTKIKIPNLNKDTTYLIGVIAGDGSMIKTKRKKGGFHYSIRIYGKGKEYLEILNEIFSKNFEIKGKIFEDKRKKDTCFLKIQNASIFFYFMINENEIGKKRRFKIPEIIKENPKYFKEYLSGLVDTDGHISRKRIQLKQKSEKLLKEIMVISNKQNLNCTIPKVNYTNKKPYYYIRFDNKIPLRFKTNNFLKQNK